MAHRKEEKAKAKEERKKEKEKRRKEKEIEKELRVVKDVEGKVIPTEGRPHSTYAGRAATRARGFLRKTKEWDKKVAAESEMLHSPRVIIDPKGKKYITGGGTKKPNYKN